MWQMKHKKLNGELAYCKVEVTPKMDKLHHVFEDNLKPNKFYDH